MTGPGAVRFPSIEGLRAFEAAARLGSFERAADELHLSASAVGKRIATVEELIGSVLLQRGGKLLTLTAAGRDYLAQVTPALGMLAAVPQHRRETQAAPKLRITTPPTFARQILVPQLDGYTAEHPEVEIEVVLSIPFAAGSGTESDVEIQHGDAVAAGGSVLMDDVVLPLAAPSLLDRLPPLRKPVDLAGAPLLRTPIEPWTPWFRAAGLDWPEPVSGPKLVDLGLTLEAAVAGQGIVLARPTLARPWLQRDSLRPLFDLTARPASQYFVLHGSGEPAAGFARWLAERCAALAAEAQALLSGRA
ncbi:LysR family transcriptional regulator [Piscinibacter sakaiensis]|uniref:LysR family transcriptional regulator n=1 Tax=Piscinibacter sakaiensis TaxID=1547922 RepID=UPI003AB0B588